MKKLIYLEDAIKAIMDLPDCPNGYSDTYDKARVIGVLEDVPSAQPEQQTRCAHCKRYDLHNHRCKWWNHGVSNVDWCSYSERRTDEH